MIQRNAWFLNQLRWPKNFAISNPLVQRKAPKTPKNSSKNAPKKSQIKPSKGEDDNFQKSKRSSNLEVEIDR